MQIAVSLGVGLCLALGAVAGRGTFAALVLLLAVLTLADGARLLAAARRRPVVPGAAVLGLGAPLLVLVETQVAWARLPVLVAAAMMLTFGLVLAFGRRSRAVAGIAATLFLGLVVGLGGSSLLLLYALPGGTRWVVALLLLLAGADAGLTLVRSNGGPPPAVPALAGGALAAVLALVVLRPPLAPLVTAALGIVAVVMVLGRAHLQEGVSAPPSVALIWRGAAGVLLAAPPAYTLARAAALSG